MSHSPVNSPEEDTELPDAPQSPPEEPPSGTESPKTEPGSDPIEPPSAARAKKAVKEEAALEEIFTDDDEDYLGDDDGTDLLASEIKVVYGNSPLFRMTDRSISSRICIVLPM